MSASIFERTLASAAMADVFADRAIVAAMLDFEGALAEAEGAEGVIPAGAVAAIAAACRETPDVDALVADARSAGSLAIPLVKRLTAMVAARDAASAAYVHRGATSQDVIDTAMVLVTKKALALIDVDLRRLSGSLLALARSHIATPILARTLMQPAQVISFGFKIVAWLAPLVRARERIARAQAAALRLQFGGAVGTLSSLGDKGPAVASRLATRLDLRLGRRRLARPARRLGRARLRGRRALRLARQDRRRRRAAGPGRGRRGRRAVGRRARRIVGDAAEEESGRGDDRDRGRRCARRITPPRLLAAMAPAHERGLGEWQAELAEWPSLFSPRTARSSPSPTPSTGWR
jgi:3-carboxy-cis,cis-muconate cycloisomerase